MTRSSSNTGSTSPAAQHDLYDTRDRTASADVPEYRGMLDGPLVPYLNAQIAIAVDPPG